MIKHPEWLDPSRDFAVRICIPVEDMDNPVTDSIQIECGECGRLVWYNPNQKVPVIPGVFFEAEISLCLPCCALYMSMSPGR